MSASSRSIRRLGAGLLLLLCTLLFATSPALAQSGATGTIEGTVLQDGIGDPLPGANVRVDGSSRGAATAPDGTFRLSGVDTGTVTLVVSVIGYETTRRSVDVAAGDVTPVTIRLREQPVEISEIVVERVMLTGGQQGLDRIPGSAQYIGPAELEEFNHSDIHRILRQVPGVYIQEEDGYGLRPNIGLRGTGVERSSKITVMEDGVLAAPAPYAAPSAYYFPTAGRMQAVEVRKGSSQIKYGPYTTGGALNLVSTQIPTEFSGRVNVLAGSEQERVLHAHAGDSGENFGFLAETYQIRTDGFKNLNGFNNADAGFDYNTGFNKADYLAKLRVNTDDDARVYQALTLKVGQTEETSNETYLGLTDADFDEQPFARYAGSQEDVMNTEHQQIQARHFLRYDSWLDVTTTAYNNQFQRNWYKLDEVQSDPNADAVGIGDLLANPDDYPDAFNLVTGDVDAQLSADGRLRVKNNNREYYSQGVQTAIGLTFGEASSLSHEIEVGARLHQDQIDRFQWENDFRMTPTGAMELVTERTPGTESNRVQTADAFATYLQYRLGYGKLTVTPGVRYETITIERENFSTSDPDRSEGPESVEENTVDVLIPGIGLDYALTESVTAFAGVHRGFSPPGSDPETDPESSINYELGTRVQRPGLRAQGVVFYNDYTNLLGRRLQAVGSPQSGDLFNGGDAQVYGVELLAQYDLGLPAGTSFSIPLDLSYTYTSATFANSFESDFGPWGTVEDGDELPYLPNHQLSAGLGIDGWNGLGLRVAGRYIGEMRTVAGQGDFPSETGIDSYVVFDASADYQVTRFAQVFGSIRNLGDATYAVARRPAGLRPGLPRTVQLGVRVSF